MSVTIDAQGNIHDGLGKFSEKSNTAPTGLERVLSTREVRDRYQAEHPEDPRPSRFDGTAAYAEWAERADRWGGIETTDEVRRRNTTPVPGGDAHLLRASHKSVFDDGPVGTEIVVPSTIGGYENPHRRWVKQEKARGHTGGDLWVDREFGGEKRASELWDVLAHAAPGRELGPWAMLDDGKTTIRVPEETECELDVLVGKAGVPVPAGCVDVGPHERGADGVCRHCHETDQYAANGWDTFEAYSEWWYANEYEGEPGHTHEDRTHFDYYRATCHANASTK